MDNAKIIDFVAYQTKHEADPLPLDELFPEDLISAIQILIRRLREAKPLKNTG